MAIQGYTSSLTITINSLKDTSFYDVMKLMQFYIKLQQSHLVYHLDSYSDLAEKCIIFWASF